MEWIARRRGKLPSPFQNREAPFLQFKFLRHHRITRVGSAPSIIRKTKNGRGLIFSLPSNFIDNSPTDPDLYSTLKPAKSAENSSPNPPNDANLTPKNEDKIYGFKPAGTFFSHCRFGF